MKWTVKITTTIGWLELPLDGYFRTKKEAEAIADKAKEFVDVLEVEVIKK